MEINLKEKLFYNIGEVAEAFNVNPSLIRYWEKEFKILSPKKTLKGTRKYNSVDIKNLKLIYNLLKNRGFTIEGAKEKIKSESKKIEIVEKLERIKAQLILIEKDKLVDGKIFIDLEPSLTLTFFKIFRTFFDFF